MGVETYLLVETREKIESSLQGLDIDSCCWSCGSSGGSGIVSSGRGSGIWSGRSLSVRRITKSSLMKLRSAGIDVSEDSCDSLETFCDVGLDSELLCGRNGMRVCVDSGAVWVA